MVPAEGLEGMGGGDMVQAEGLDDAEAVDTMYLFANELTGPAQGQGGYGPDFDVMGGGEYEDETRAPAYGTVGRRSTGATPRGRRRASHAPPPPPALSRPSGPVPSTWKEFYDTETTAYRLAKPSSDGGGGAGGGGSGGGGGGGGGGGRGRRELTYWTYERRGVQMATV